jgi:hypothetical protein
MNHFPKKAILASLVLPFTLGAASASAAQITEWDYTVDNAFTNATYTDGEGTPVSTEQDLTWGSDGVTSSVSITDVSAPPADRLITNGGLAAGGEFTHNNQAIPNDSAMLASFDLNSTLHLIARAPAEMDGAEPEPVSVSFSSFFTETYNGGSCFEGSESVCDDVFSLQNPEFGSVNAAGNFEAAAQNFTIDGYNYTVFLEIVGLNTLTDEQCGVADAPANCIGFLTQEDNVNTFTSNFRIESSAVSVPEPGSLALLGLGLVGLGVASRRK